MSQTDRQTNSLTPFTGYVDFFFQLNLLPPYSLCSQGDNLKKVFTYLVIFQVSEPDLSQIQLNLIEPDDVKVLTSSNFTGGIEVGVGRKVWVPFFVQLPPQTITPVQVSLLIKFYLDLISFK